MTGQRSARPSSGQRDALKRMPARRRFLLGTLILCTAASTASAAPDYSKRALPLSDSLRASLIGKWTNPVDDLIIEIDSVDPVSGEIRGREWPTTPFRSDSSPAGTEHDLRGWVSGAPPKQGFDNVVPVTFTTTLFEYGSLPVWAGYLRDGKIETMSYLVWPNRTYPWDHFSAISQTWTKLP
jgi:hypothetical protein